VLVRALAYILAYGRECGNTEDACVDANYIRKHLKARTTSLFLPSMPEVCSATASKKKNSVSTMDIGSGDDTAFILHHGVSADCGERYIEPRNRNPRKNATSSSMR